MNFSALLDPSLHSVTNNRKYQNNLCATKTIYTELIEFAIEVTWKPLLRCYRLKSDLFTTLCEKTN